MMEADLEGLGALVAISALNGEIQVYVSERGAEVPPDLIKQLSDLDWTVRNAFARKREAVQRELRRRGPERYRFPGTRLRERAEEAWGRVLDRITVNPSPPPGKVPDEVGVPDPGRGLRLLDGHVWCETHQVVHPDSTDAFGGTCDALDRRDLYVREGEGT